MRNRTLPLRRLGLARGAPYVRESLDAHVDEYLSGVRSRGYYEATLTPVVDLVDGGRDVVRRWSSHHAQAEPAEPAGSGFETIRSEQWGP